MASICTKSIFIFCHTYFKRPPFSTPFLRAFHFDREHRTPEVHAASKLSKAVILMEQPSSENRNSGMELTNIMLNVWNPLIDILNDGKCYSMMGAEDDFKWLKVYLSEDKDEIERTLKMIFEEMK